MDIRLPNLGEGAEAGTVASILVEAGDVVEKDQVLIELESEKAVISIPSTTAGRVSKIHVRKGDEIRVGAIIVSFDGGEESGAGGEKRSVEPGNEPPKRPTMQGLPKPDAPPSPPPELPEGVRPGASPTIRRMARDLGIDLRRIRGTARGGRIMVADIRDYVARLQQAAGTHVSTAPPAAPRPAATPGIDFSRWGPVRVQRATALRKTIASRMADSWRTIPHVAQFGDADITALMALRKQYLPIYKEQNARLTLTPILLKAVANALARHPVVNSSWDETSGDIVLKDYVHIGLAVDTDAGLIVPVIRDVDRKSVLELAREVEALTERTRRRQVSMDEMQGGTFTVSNQGGIGGAHFTPIINKPEAAILGVGRGREMLRKVDGEIRTRIVLPLTLSHDHRVIDGANGVRFLVDLVETIEGFPAEALARLSHGFSSRRVGDAVRARRAPGGHRRRT